MDTPSSFFPTREQLKQKLLDWQQQYGSDFSLKAMAKLANILQFAYMLSSAEILQENGVEIAISLKIDMQTRQQKMRQLLQQWISVHQAPTLVDYQELGQIAEAMFWVNGFSLSQFNLAENEKQSLRLFRDEFISAGLNPADHVPRLISFIADKWMIDGKPVIAEEKDVPTLRQLHQLITFMGYNATERLNEVGFNIEEVH